MADSTSTRKTPSKRGPYFMKFHGLQACLKTPHRKGNLRSMLVSHAFVDLWHIIEEDKSFDKGLFDRLDESERDFMRHCLNKCKIESRGFESSYNQTISHLVDRLKMLQGAKAIGDDNASISPEINAILDKLYQKNVFSTSYYNQFKRLLTRPS